MNEEIFVYYGDHAEEFGWKCRCSYCNGGETDDEDTDFEEYEDTDNDQAEGTDLSENTLQVTDAFVILTDQRSGTSEEGVRAGGDDYTFSFTLLAGRATARERSIKGLLDLQRTEYTHEKH